MEGKRITKTGRHFPLNLYNKLEEKLKEGKTEETEATQETQSAPESDKSLIKCPKCGREVEKERVKNAKYICYECGSYFRVKTENRIRMVTDPKSFEPWFEDMPSSNPLGTEGYEDKVAAAQAKTNLKEAVTIGKATINGEPAVVGVCDARFLMSSMGYVVGEKIKSSVASVFIAAKIFRS